MSISQTAGMRNRVYVLGGDRIRETQGLWCDWEGDALTRLWVKVIESKPFGVFLQFFVNAPNLDAFSD